MVRADKEPIHLLECINELKVVDFRNVLISHILHAHLFHHQLLWNQHRMAGS